MVLRAIVRQGDSTSHGGVVREGFSTVRLFGQQVAGIGHRGYCPACRTEFVIAGGSHRARFMGVQVALEGMSTSCGAVLNASQHQAKVDDGLPTDQVPSSPSVAARMITPSHSHSYDMHFIVRGERSGTPLPRVPYKLELEDGTAIIGVTDEHGCTDRISADRPALATLTVPYHDVHSSQANETDPDFGCDCCLGEHSGKNKERSGMG